MTAGLVEATGPPAAVGSRADPAPKRPVPDALVLIAHGSPDARHARGVHAIARRVQVLTGVATVPAFLEYDVPSIAEALQVPGGHTLVLPLLFGAGFHWHRDIPPIVSHHGEQRRLAAPIAPIDLGPAVNALLETGATPDHVVLAVAGSRDQTLPSRLRPLASAVASQGPRVELAMSPAEVRRVARPGSMVVPLVVAEGVFADRIRQAATIQGANSTRAVGEHPLFAVGLARRALSR